MASSEESQTFGEARTPVTFLFTDIEGSTKRWERYPEAMGRAVARHDEIMRAAIARHNGHVFKTVGDAFCAVFPSAADAISASVAAQQAIAAEDWGEVGPIRVRMGMHTGHAEERDADYFGPTVNRVARIASAGHGGQTLLSSATTEHAGERLPLEVSVRDLGKHRLKDLARPERILQLIAAGLPGDFPRLKTVPSPTPGIMAALLSTLVPLILFRVANRTSSEQVDASLFSPLSIYTGLKGLVIELSTLNEYVLLAVGLLLLAGAIGFGIARWRAAQREERLRDVSDPGRFNRWVVNQRTVAFLGVFALLVLGAFGYQQYLWRVALPIPDDALGIAMTREASAAVVQEELADSLYSQGHAEQIIMRELPVVFDARDTGRARELGKRIGAHAVIIYRTDELSDGSRQYIAYVVFTDPSIGLALAGSADAAGSSGQPVVVKEGVPVPVLRTDTIEELVNAAAGIIAYDADEAREAVEYLQLAVPDDPASPNSGIVNFYLGNAYNLDNQPELAADAFEDAASHYERRISDGETLGPQDQLILAKTYMERGRAASFTNDWEGALEWYERAVKLRADLLARVDGLERPTDLHATYARLYTLMADAYRYMDLAEDQRSWESRAVDEIDALAGEASPDDPYALVQQSTAYTFVGDCVQARSVLDEALESEPNDIDALINAGIIALLQDRPDLARTYWERIIDAYPDNITARKLIAESLVLTSLGGPYTEPAYLSEAEGQYQEIIEIDPANVFAYEELASLATLRGDAFILDSTALVTGDDLSLAKSQQTWPLDPDRRQAALEAYGVVIDARRVIASELEPDSPAAAVAVAEAYVARQRLLYTALTGPLLLGEQNPEADALGEQVLADARQIEEWTDQVFDNPDATRLDLLRAWAARVESLDREWGWYAFVEGDEQKAGEAEQRYRDAVEEAIAFIEEQTTETLDEIPPVRIVYFKAYFIKEQLDQDPEAAAGYMDQVGDLTRLEHEGRDEGIRHYTTFCNERREQSEADSLLAQGDMDGAKEHYEAALEANPKHIESLQGYGEALYLDNDIDGAVTQVSKATQIAPGMPGPWVDLVIYQLRAGDTPAALTSLQRFLDVAAERPAQERMHLLGEAIGELRALVEEQPDLVPEVLDTVEPLRQALDAMPREELPSFQYAMLYADLGELALYMDTASAAEPLLQRALELDPHLPATQAHLVIALLVQGEDAGAAVVDRALDEAENPYWSSILDYEDPTSLRAMMEDEVSRYVEAFPEREEAMAPFLSSLEQAGQDPALPATGVEGSVYTSAINGFTLTWDDSWSVSGASTDARTGVDSIQVSNGTSTVQLSTMTGAASPAGCMQMVLSAIEGDAAWQAVVAARDPDGNRIGGTAEESASAAFVDGADSDATMPAVYYLECVPLPESATHVLVFVIVPMEAYEDQRDQVNRLLSNLRAGEPDDSPVVGPVELPMIDLESR